MCGEVTVYRRERVEIMCFDFEIIICSDGLEIIDRRQKTFYHQLTPVQMVEYIEMEIQLAILDGLVQEERIDCMRLLEI